MPLDPGPAVEGRIVNVSAGGIRVASPAAALAVGESVRLEVFLDDPARPEGPPRLVLDGEGRIVWVRASSAGGHDTGVRFRKPMDVRRTFPSVRIF